LFSSVRRGFGCCPLLLFFFLSFRPPAPSRQGSLLRGWLPIRPSQCAHCWQQAGELLVLSFIVTTHAQLGTNARLTGDTRRQQPAAANTPDHYNTLFPAPKNPRPSVSAPTKTNSLLTSTRGLPTTPTHTPTPSGTHQTCPLVHHPPSALCDHGSMAGLPGCRRRLAAEV
jgi:hypothetical protein